MCLVTSVFHNPWGVTQQIPRLSEYLRERGHTGPMRLVMRAALALAALGVIASVSGCSSASDPVEPAMSRQLDAAESVVYSVMTDPTTSAPTPEALLDRLSAAAILWDAEEDAPSFSEDEGTPVLYNYQMDAGDKDGAFDLFVASGIDKHHSIPGWFDSRPIRVYTCYRIEVSFEAGTLSDFRRSHDYGEDQLTCPPKLVSALGDGAQYREPWIFDG